MMCGEVPYNEINAEVMLKKILFLNLKCYLSLFNPKKNNFGPVFHHLQTWTLIHPTTVC